MKPLSHAKSILLIVASSIWNRSRSKRLGPVGPTRACKDTRVNQGDVILRTLWRRALALTGSRDGAVRALEHLLRVQPNVLKLSDDRRNRLIVIGARAWAASQSGDDAKDNSIESLTRRLEHLPREAWVFCDVEQWSDVQASRAMGVPRAAVASYLDQARSRLQAALGDRYPAMLQQFRAHAGADDHESGIQDAQRRARGGLLRRRAVSIAQVLILLLFMGVLAWVGLDLMHAADHERARNAAGDHISNPIPPEDASRQRTREHQQERNGP